MIQSKVLFAFDDDLQILEVITALGRNAGFEVHTDTSPQNLLLRLADVSPDVIVLDLQMPQMDGVEVLRHLAERGIRAGVILLSGMDQRTISAAERFGASRGVRVCGTLQKPFLPEELQATLLSAATAVSEIDSESIEDGLLNEQFLVYYQPTICHFADGTWDVAAMEALLRWDHPGKGLLAPDSFLAIAEAAELGGPMTDFVIRESLKQLNAWRSSRLGLGLRINMSAGLITDIDFPDRLELALRENGVDPEALTLEITETAMLEQSPKMFDIMTRLRVKNVNLAIDDFGIGYSSLTQLFRMPFSEMKIDKSLMMRTPDDREAAIMVAALVDLGHKLGLTVCAEGVETLETLEYLAQIGCDSAQGYYISQPVPQSRVTDFVASWQARRDARAGAPLVVEATVVGETG